MLVLGKAEHSLIGVLAERMQRRYKVDKRHKQHRVCMKTGEWNVHLLNRHSSAVAGSGQAVELKRRFQRACLM